MSELFNRRIEQAEKRLDALQEMVQREPGSNEAFPEAVEELAIVLEELRVAQEELAVQQEELAVAHEELDTERLRYQQLFEFAPDGYLVTDPRGIVQEANRAALDLLGVSRKMLINKPLVAFVRDEDRKFFGNLLVSLEEGLVTQGRKWELYLESRGRAPVPAALTVARVHDLAGAVVGLRWLARDITATKRAEERERLLVQIAQDRADIEDLVRDLEQERKILKMIMENTYTQLAYLDTEFNFVRVNTAYARGAGHTKEELIGRNHFEVFPNPENEAIFEGVRDFGRPVQYRARPFEYADRPELGTTYWDWTLVPVRDTHGHVQGLVLSLLDVTDRIRAAQERERLMGLLDAERARLKAIIDNAPEAIVVTDPSSRIVLANPMAQQLYGRQVPVGEPFENHAALFLCHPDGTPYEPGDLPLSRAAIDGEIHTNLEMTVCKPGRWRDLLVSTAPIRDSEGRIDGVVSVFQDITERKRIEEALRRYAARLQVLHAVDHSILAAESVDAVAEIVVAHLRRQVPCTRASVALLDREANGVSLLAATANGKTRLAVGWRGPLGPDWPLGQLQRGEACVWEDLQAANLVTPFYTILEEEGVRAYVQLPLRTRGHLIGSLDMGMAVPGEPDPEYLDTAHEMAYGLAITIEQARLHEQVERHAEELEEMVARRTAALQASEARLRTIFDGAAIGIALSDMKGRILETNPALERMLGYSSAELKDKFFTEITHPKDAAADLTLFRDLVAGQRDEYKLEKRYICKDGEVIWANLTVSLVRGTEGEPLYAVGMVEDVTERKRIQEALLNAEKLAIAGRMGASLAHEINNPLQSVIGCLGLAERNLPEGVDAGRYLGVARQELRRAARIVSQLRDMSRPSEEETKEAVDLNALLEEVLVLSRKQAQERRVEALWEPGEALPVVQAVPDRLRQVFLNLALNAFDAMPEGGQLRVTTERTGSPGGVRVAFSDTGVGMTSDTLSKLFDPFYTTKSQGLGLGLYISHNIVEEHGGHIDVTSRLGEGTTFTVWLPA
jgi:PAS domain S-box-containing protein